MRRRRIGLGGGIAVAVGSVIALVGAPASAQDDTPVPTSAPPTSAPPTTLPPVDADPGTATGGSGGDTTPGTLPLIPIPAGCEEPVLPHIVFIGAVADRDFRTIRYDIEVIRSGRGAPFSKDGQIDVRYGLDTQYLHDGEQYLVSAIVDPDLGLLVSRVTEPIEHFGGDEVIGVSETDVNCPELDDPARTLHPDGTPIEASVIEPFLDAKARIAGAFLLPFAVAVGIVFALAMLRVSVAGVYNSVADVASRRRARRRFFR